MTPYLPAEWHPQSAIELTWPHSDTDWQWVLDDIQHFYLHLIHTITCYQPVILSVPNKDAINAIKSRLQQHTAKQNQINSIDPAKSKYDCEFYISANNDTWARDHGPISVYENEQLTIHDFQFNGWGDKFNAHLDNQITANLFQQNAFPTDAYKEHSLVLEGGSIESNGNGCLLTTTRCLLNDNRNPSWSQTQIEAYLKQHLGCKKVLWLQQGELVGDDTDAHIDTLARFAPDNQIIFQGCQDPSDKHYQSLNAMKDELAQFTNTNNAPFKLTELPWPDPLFETRNETNNTADQQRLPATYANFLFINGAVLIPTYGVAQDAKAIDIMATALPNYKIIPIDCRTVVRQFGSLHCLTMQIPTAWQQEYS